MGRTEDRLIPVYCMHEGRGYVSDKLRSTGCLCMGVKWPSGRRIRDRMYRYLDFWVDWLLSGFRGLMMGLLHLSSHHLSWSIVDNCHSVDIILSCVFQGIRQQEGWWITCGQRMMSRLVNTIFRLRKATQSLITNLTARQMAIDNPSMYLHSSLLIHFRHDNMDLVT